MQRWHPKSDSLRGKAIPVLGVVVLWQKFMNAAKRDNPFTADEVKQFLAPIKTDPHDYLYHNFGYCL